MKRFFALLLLLVLFFSMYAGAAQASYKTLDVTESFAAHFMPPAPTPEPTPSLTEQAGADARADTGTHARAHTGTDA